LLLPFATLDVYTHPEQPFVLYRMPGTQFLIHIDSEWLRVILLHAHGVAALTAAKQQHIKVIIYVVTSMSMRGHIIVYLLDHKMERSRYQIRKVSCTDIRKWHMLMLLGIPIVWRQQKGKMSPRFLPACCGRQTLHTCRKIWKSGVWPSSKYIADVLPGLFCSRTPLNLLISYYIQKGWDIYPFLFPLRWRSFAVPSTKETSFP